MSKPTAPLLPPADGDVFADGGPDYGPVVAAPPAALDVERVIRFAVSFAVHSPESKPECNSCDALAARAIRAYEREDDGDETDHIAFTGDEYKRRP